MIFYKSQTKWKLCFNKESLFSSINYFEISFSTLYFTKFHLDKNLIFFFFWVAKFMTATILKFIIIFIKDKYDFQK